MTQLESCFWFKTGAAIGDDIRVSMGEPDVYTLGIQPRPFPPFWESFETEVLFHSILKSLGSSLEFYDAPSLHSKLFGGVIVFKEYWLYTDFIVHLKLQAMQIFFRIIAWASIIIWR